MFHFRDVQEEVLELRKHKQEEEHTLQEVQEIIACHDTKFQDVNRKLERATDRCSSASFHLATVCVKCFY